jgi:hypothetical protein
MEDRAMKPWEKYAPQTQAGPWQKFDGGQPSEAQAPFANGPLKMGADSFPDQLSQELENAGWAGRNLAGVGSAVVNAYQGLKGAIPGLESDPNQVRDQKIIADAAPVGNIAGNVAMLAPTALIPGANTVTGAATIGAVQGALLTPGDIAERMKAAGMGAGGGSIGAGASKLFGAARPIARNQDAGVLAREGISLTPGQNAGGVLKSLEDKFTSIPFVGDVIQNARKRGVEDFNRAAIRRATLPGMDVDGIGNTAIQELRQGLGSAYDDVLSRSSANALDPQFVQEMASLRSMVSALPKKEQQAFDGIIQREINQRMAPNGMVNAENLQAVKSGMGGQIDNFATSSDGYQRQLAQALKQADAEFRSLVSRTNPQNAAELKAIDTAYANFKRIQRAASGVGAENGVFTPAQLHNAVKAMDKTKDKRAFSEGTAMLQDLTSAGKATLPSKVPDSGTTGRLAANVTSLGGLLSMAGGGAAAIPALVAYSRPGSAAINGMVNNGAIPLAELVRSIGANNPDLLRLLGTALPREMELMR